jgi:hypothetical protein
VAVAGAENIRVDSAGNVGIGTNSPARKLHLGSGSIRLIDQQQVEWGGTRNAIEGSESSNYIRLWTNNLTRFQVDSSGYVTKPYQPSFFVWSNYSSGGGPSGAYIFSNVDHNIGSGYSTATGRFTAPVAGRYLLMAGILSRSSNGINIQFYKNSTIIAYSEDSRSGGFGEANLSLVVNLAAGDYVFVYANQATYGGLYDWFSGYLLG